MFNQFRFSIALMLTLAIQPTFASNDQFSDGPYVEKAGEQLHFQWMCKGKKQTVNYVEKQLPLAFQQCGLNANVNKTQFNEQKLLTFNGDFPVAAVSDFHGQYDIMHQLLTNNGIINKQGDWSFGNGHFVITGDVFDRGDKVTEILWFLYRLEQQANKAGGKVHLLLGNHEVMVLNGDLRYLHPKYVATQTVLGVPFEQLFTQNTILGNWLRSKPVLVKVNNMLFAHGGFHPKLAKDKHSLQDINSAFKTNLVKSELPEQQRSAFGHQLHKTNGPIWYRGYFKDTGASSAEINMLLNHFDVEHIVVGHTSQKQVETRFEGRVIAIDSSIKRGEYGEILLVEKKNKWRGTLQGKKLPLSR